MSGAIFEPVSLDDIDGHDNLLQTGYWGRVKQKFDWEPVSFLFNGHPMLVLLRKLPGGFTIAYVPHGPQMEVDPHFFAGFAGKLAEHLPDTVTFIRFDLPWQVDSWEDRKTWLKRPFRKSLVDIQPPDTVLISLAESEEEILSRMKRKTRYNIRLAERKGVSIRTGGLPELEKWYAIYEETAERDGITIHSFEYYRRVFQEGLKQKNPSVRLLLADIDNEIMAGNILVLHGSCSTYLYGASSSEKRNYMPTYLLQWEGMRIAREHGCESYDMFGIPPVADEGEPMYGLFRFKTGFGGQIVNRAGCWDYPVNKAAYTLYRTAEKARNFYYKRLRR